MYNIRNISPLLKKRLIISALFLLVIIAGITAVQLLRDSGVSEQTPPRTRAVETVRVSELAKNVTPLPLIGEVRSIREATIRAETQGRVTALYQNAGDRITAGTIIGEMRNASEQASVAQARAQVEQARAALAKTRSGARSEQVSLRRIEVNKARTAFTEAKNQAINTIKNSFTVLDDAIRNKTDELYSNPRGDDPELLFTSAYSNREIQLKQQRKDIERMLNAWEQTITVANTDSEVENLLQNARGNAQTVNTYLDLAASLVNSLESHSGLSQSTINTWRSAVATARTSVNGLINEIAQSGDTLSSRRGALETAETNLEQTLAGERPEDITAAEAELSRALSSLDAARANLEKTLFRSPISGTISILPVAEGDFVSNLDRIAIISNENALEIETFITAEDMREIAVGAPVRIDGRFDGVVTDIAPGLDPDTKKIEMRVGITAAESNLLHGESVALSVSRSGENLPTGGYLIPLSALKIENDRKVVFSVSEDNTLVAHAVTEGPLLGEHIVITAGITPEMRIVRDARGLQAGDTVRITQN